ncbi:hypothetical protein B0H19DRAFT_1276253 [Mycena capillaripes]|nr:hypothetical protein B0H19DRAFT_1276253 [Mycena capillaripes]
MSRQPHACARLPSAFNHLRAAFACITPNAILARPRYGRKLGSLIHFGGRAAKTLLKQYLQNCNDKHKRDLRLECEAEENDSDDWCQPSHSKSKATRPRSQSQDGGGAGLENEPEEWAGDNDDEEEPNTGDNDNDTIPVDGHEIEIDDLNLALDNDMLVFPDDDTLPEAQLHQPDWEDAAENNVENEFPDGESETHPLVEKKATRKYQRPKIDSPVPSPLAAVGSKKQVLTDTVERLLSGRISQAQIAHTVAELVDTPRRWDDANDTNVLISRQDFIDCILIPHTIKQVTNLMIYNPIQAPEDVSNGTGTSEIPKLKLDLADPLMKKAAKPSVITLDFPPPAIKKKKLEVKTMVQTTIAVDGKAQWPPATPSNDSARSAPLVALSVIDRAPATSPALPTSTTTDRAPCTAPFRPAFFDPDSALFQ